MTDLERVREFIGLHTTPTKAIELQAIVDAHLEEDAEKAADAFAVEGQLLEKWAELEVENERLSKGMNRFSIVVKQRDTLLAALRGCLEWFEANPVNETGRYHERQARAVIAEVVKGS